MSYGRKSKFDTVIKPNLELIDGWLRTGITERDIARRLHIAHSTFQAYKRQFPDFSDRLKKGRELADIQIENALFRAAIGFEVEEIRTEFSDSSRTKSKKVTKVTRKVPGDVIAQIFWLKNRCPDKWHDRREIKKK